MSYGFEVLNETGEIISDSNYLGYGLVETKTFTLSHLQNPLTVNFSQVITSQSPPIIAVQMQNWNKTYIKICRPTGGPGAWTGVYFVGIRFDNASPASRVWTFRVYANVESTESYGIRIKNNLNMVTFDSGLKQLKFRQILGGPDTYPVIQQIATAYERVLVTREDKTMIPPGAWVPLSLCNWQTTTTHQSNASGKWRTYNMFIHTCFGWKDNKMLIIIELYSPTTPLTYEVVVPLHYQVILD